MTSERDRELVLQHYLRYVVQDESGSMRERIQSAIVEYALRGTSGTPGLSVSDVSYRITENTGLPEFPKPQVTQLINTLLELRAVESASSTKDARYRLTAARDQFLDRAIAETERLEQSFLSGAINRIQASHGSLKSEDADRIRASFRTFVARMLDRFRESCAKRLVEDQGWGELSQFVGYHEELVASVTGVGGDLADSAIEAFEAILRDPGPAERRYLYAAGQVYFVVNLLHLDPRLQALQRERFGETVLFVDTNIIIAALLETHRQHQAVSALLQLCTGLGFPMELSKDTEKEFESLIEAAEEEYRHAPPFNLELAQKLAPLVENPILAEFFGTHEEIQLSWPHFLVKIGAWRPTMREKYGVAIGETTLTRNHRRFSRLESVIRGTPRIKDGKRWYARPPRAITHDAHMISAVEGLAGADSGVRHPFGSKYWFITLDRYLADCARKARDSSAPAVCMLAEEWAQYISPFLGPDVSAQERADVYGGLLSDRFTRSMSGDMTLAEIQPFTAPGVDKLLADVPGDEACRVIADLRSQGFLPGGKDEQDPEELLARLNAFVERAEAKRLERGELVPAEEAERIRKSGAQALADSEAELRHARDHAGELERMLASYRNTSLKHWVAVAKAKGRLLSDRTRAQVRLRAHEIVLVGAAVLVGAVLAATHTLGTAGNIIQYSSFAIAVVLGIASYLRRR